MVDLKNKEWLSQQYLVEKKSTRDIAKMCGSTRTTIKYYLKKYGILTRGVSEGMLLKSDYLSQKSKKYFADPTNRLAMSDKIKKVMRDTDKEILSNRVKESWKQNRKTLIAGIKKGTTAQKRKKISDSLKETWTDDRKTIQSNISQELWKTDEYRLHMSQGLNPIVSSIEFREKVSKNSLNMWKDRHYREKQAKSRSNLPATSILEKIIKDILKQDYNIDASGESHGPWAFDTGFSYDNRKILIECQGGYWHNLEKTKLKDRQKKTYYDRYLASTHELYYIYEYQFYGINSIRNIIRNILNIDAICEVFNFQDLIIKTISPDDANNFYNKYHYLNKSRGGIHIGVFLTNNLIACATYSGVTRKETADRLKLECFEVLELLRFCIHPSYHKKNFASWFLGKTYKFIPDSVKTLISFSDSGAGHDGTIYKASNWKINGKSINTYWYIDSNGARYHKKSVWDQASRLKITEKAYADKFGLVKIIGKPLERFIYML